VGKILSLLSQSGVCACACVCHLGALVGTGQLGCPFGVTMPPPLMSPFPSGGPAAENHLHRLAAPPRPSRTFKAVKSCVSIKSARPGAIRPFLGEDKTTNSSDNNNDDDGPSYRPAVAAAERGRARTGALIPSTILIQPRVATGLFALASRPGRLGDPSCA
jgi:hypothetical protein